MEHRHIPNINHCPKFIVFIVIDMRLCQNVVELESLEKLLEIFSQLRLRKVAGAK